MLSLYCAFGTSLWQMRLMKVDGKTVGQKKLAQGSLFLGLR